MHADLDRISIWSDRTSPVYEMCHGTLRLRKTDDYVTIRVPNAEFDPTGAPHDVHGYSIVASDADGLVYEGQIRTVQRQNTMAVSRMTFKCFPKRIP